MAQFDSLIIFPLLSSLLLTLVLYYNLSIKVIIPSFFEVKKFRVKKLNISSFYQLLNNNSNVTAAKSYKPIFD